MSLGRRIVSCAEVIPDAWHKHRGKVASAPQQCNSAQGPQIPTALRACSAARKACSLPPFVLSPGNIGKHNKSIVLPVSQHPATMLRAPEIISIMLQCASLQLVRVALGWTRLTNPRQSL